MSERLAFSLGARRDVGTVSPDSIGVGTAVAPPAGVNVVTAPPPALAETRDWAFTWTLVFTAVLFLRPQDVFPPLGALHLAEVSALLGLISLFMGRLARRQTLTRMTPELAGVLAFGGLMLLTAPFSIWFGGAVNVFFELYSKVILVYLLAVNVLGSPRRLERLTWILVIALGYLGFRAVFDYARGVNVIQGGTRVMGSVGGIMQNPNDMALNMVSFLPLAAVLAMQAKTLPKRLVAAGCGVMMMGAIVATGSRGGFLGFAMMLVVLAIFAARKRPGFVFAGALFVICALPLAPSSYWQRIASITDDSKDDVESSQARRTLMVESFAAFVERPLTGVGAGQFKDWNPQGRTEAWHEAHNVWLQVGAELGIFGIAMFLFLVFRAFHAVFQSRRLLRRNRPKRSRISAGAATAGGATGTLDGPGIADAEFLDAHSAAMAASLAGWFVCAFFASVAYNWTFYYLLALAAAPREILRARGLAAAALASAGRMRGRLGTTAFTPSVLEGAARKAGA